MTKYKSQKQIPVSIYLLGELVNIIYHISFFSSFPCKERLSLALCSSFSFIFLSFCALNPKWTISQQYLYFNQLPDYPLCCTD